MFAWSVAGLLLLLGTFENGKSFLHCSVCFRSRQSQWMRYRRAGECLRHGMEWKICFSPVTDSIFFGSERCYQPTEKPLVLGHGRGRRGKNSKEENAISKVEVEWQKQKTMRNFSSIFSLYFLVVCCWGNRVSLNEKSRKFHNTLDFREEDDWKRK